MIGKCPDEIRLEPSSSYRYVFLSIGQLGLLIPQHQVHALEPSFDVQRSKGGDATGWISVTGASSPVYCLSENLQLIHEIPTDRNICVLLDIGDGLFGILCDQVVMLTQAELEIRPLPACMQGPDTPLRGLVLYGEKVLCVTSADDLQACLGVKPEVVGKPDPAQLLNGEAV